MAEVDNFDLGKVRESLEYNFHWHYVEQEGESVRFDTADGKSLWIHSSGDWEGFEPKGNMRKMLKQLGVKGL